MYKTDIEINTEFITLTNLLKYSGLIASGGQAHELIEEGRIKLNNVVVFEKRKKVYPGDSVEMDGQEILNIVAEK